MTSYGQFCPVAKASEILGDKWTVLIVRELLLGTRRFSEFQRALSRISPTVLNARLKMLEDKGVLVRKRVSGLRGHEYRLTPMGRELGPIVDSLAVWGMRWARGQMSDDELDVEFLMWDLQRRIGVEHLPDGETVVCFSFPELKAHARWWIVVRDGEVDLCTEDPGRDVGLYVTAKLRALVEVWRGDRSLRAAVRAGDVKTVGDRALARTMNDWLGICAYADVKPAT